MMCAYFKFHGVKNYPLIFCYTHQCLCVLEYIFVTSCKHVLSVFRGNSLRYMQHLQCTDRIELTDVIVNIFALIIVY